MQDTANARFAIVQNELAEPTLYPALPSLVKLAKAVGLATAVITDGLTLSPKPLDSMAGSLNWIGLSIDDLTSSLNQRIEQDGRYHLRHRRRLVATGR